MRAFILILILSITVSLFTPSSAQQYLDAGRHYMKLTEVSADRTYGYDSRNPVKVGTNRKAIPTYLNSLKPTDNDKFHVGDMRFDHDGVEGLTMVVLIYEHKKEKTPVYFLTTEFEQPKALMGFMYKTADDIPKLFPKDSIVRVKSCSDDDIYAVDDALIKQVLGQAPKPDAAPVFSGGMAAVKKYFAAHPLTGEKAKQPEFKVSVAFLVSCEGKAGDFEIITPHKGEQLTYANEVLAIVNRMPQQWKPGKAKGKAVDCYQLLSFTVTEGKLENVVYK